ncbi:midcut-by-XrtH protein [Ottowia thiooxydans]|uniref:midcut-by-XrtH protein n=1 Tax=Ottowia thiooxydans TaxID=219182 RepID=UPI00146E2375|nr:midcut-by-XrtH protein [Ottowia thiooxydans]
MLSRFPIARTLAMATLLITGSSVWAGIPPPVIDYEPVPAQVPVVTAVPTLGEWTLILLAVLLTVVAYRALRGRVNGRLLSNLVLVGGAVAATAAGHGLIGQAEAVVETPAELNLSSATGGSVNGDEWTRLTNTSGVKLRIKAINPGSWNIMTPPPSEFPECQVGTVLSTNGKCDIRFSYPYQ